MARIDIPFEISRQSIIQPTKYKIAAGGQNYFYAIFNICDTWKDITDKQAVFMRGDYKIVVRLVKSQIDGYLECRIPWEVMQTPGYFDVGIFGGDRLPTSIARMKVIEGCVTEGSEPLPPSEDWFSTIERLINETGLEYVKEGEGEASIKEGINTSAMGKSSHAEGTHTVAVKQYSHAEGNRTTAFGGNGSHAEGTSGYPAILNGYITPTSTKTEVVTAWINAKSLFSIAYGTASHSEGYNTVALGSGSHTEGNQSLAYLDSGHAEGKNTIAYGNYSHAEGQGTELSQRNIMATIVEKGGSLTYDDIMSVSGISLAYGTASHTEGCVCIAYGKYSHAEGNNNKSKGDASHSEGYNTQAIGKYSHTEGSSSQAIGESSHAEGYNTHAEGKNSHAEGNNTHALGVNSHAEGNNTNVLGVNSHAEGYNTYVEGGNSHAEGNSTHAIGANSHSEGHNTQAIGRTCHVEGYNSVADGDYSHAEGQSTKSHGSSTHAEGYQTLAYGNYSHAEGMNTIAWGYASHIECLSRNYLTVDEIETALESANTNGISAEDALIEIYNTKDFSMAYGSYSHVEGCSNLGLGFASHTEGFYNINKGYGSHVEGYHNIGQSDYGHVTGKYNEPGEKDEFAVIVGNGKSESTRSNAYTLDWEGNGTFAGNIEAKAIILKSSTSGSAKKFRLTIDDEGNLITTEI